MTRIRPVDPATLSPDVHAMYEALGSDAFSAVMAQSPQLLKGFLALDDALLHGAFRPRVIEQLAITVSEANGCVYCLSEHVHAAAGLRVSPEEIERNRTAQADDVKVQAALEFARAVVDSRGGVSDSDIEKVRAAGYDEREILELVGQVALNTLSNYLNQLIDLPPDAPRVELRPELAAATSTPTAAASRS